MADDSAATRQLIRRTLGRAGIEVDEASTGEEALASVLARRPDLVLLDISMPGMDGLEVLARLRESTKSPVILLTACGRREDRIRGLDLGADDCIVKPFSPGELAARVRAVLRRSLRVAPTGVLEFEGLRRLRTKIEVDAARPKWIRTLQRVGYCFEPDHTPRERGEGW